MIRLLPLPAVIALGLALVTQAPVHAFDGTPTLTQYGPPYGGGPYRPDPREWGPEERSRRFPPPRSGYPIVRDPCIAYGDCSGRRPQMPPFPDRYDLFDGE